MSKPHSQGFAQAPNHRRRRAAAVLAVAVVIGGPAAAANGAEGSSGSPARRSTADAPRPQRLPPIAAREGRAEAGDRVGFYPLRQRGQRDAAPLAPATPKDASAAVDSGWLRSSTAYASAQQSRVRLAAAQREHRLGALASAEASAWDALRLAAEAADKAGGRKSPGGASAQSELARARRTMREAREFVSAGADATPQAIARRARSHQTEVLHGEPLESVTTGEAIDRYLNDARIRLSRVAERSPEAAKALDLLAAVYRRRGGEHRLPSATALCLRRAAVQGQPADAAVAARLGRHLAEVGLFAEAQWALRHSLSLQADAETAMSLADLLRRTGRADQAEQVLAALEHDGSLRQRGDDLPEIVQLSPREFAAVSEPVFDAGRSPAGRSPSAADREHDADGESAGAAAEAAAQAPTGLRTVAASHRRRSPAPHDVLPAAAEARTEKGAEGEPPWWRRWSGSFRRLWRGDAK